MYDKQKHKITIVPGWLVPIRKKKTIFQEKRKTENFMILKKENKIQNRTDKVTKNY